jgi:hypothetical protein
VRRFFSVTLELVAFVVALYGFFTFPLGRYTAWGHTQAIFTSAPAHEAAKELKQAGLRLVDTALGKDKESQPEGGPSQELRNSTVRKPMR